MAKDMTKLLKLFTYNLSKFVWPQQRRGQFCSTGWNQFLLLYNFFKVATALTRITARLAWMRNARWNLIAPTPWSPPATRHRPRGSTARAQAGRKLLSPSHGSVTTLLYRVDPENVEAIHGIGPITLNLYLLIGYVWAPVLILNSDRRRCQRLAVPKFEYMSVIEFYICLRCRRNMEAGDV
jgi:hypothetical protein